MLLACDDCSWLLGFSADWFLTKLDFFLVVWGFLESVIRLPFWEFIVGIGVQALVPSWALDLLINLLSLTSIFSLNEALPAETLKIKNHQELMQFRD